MDQPGVFQTANFLMAATTLFSGLSFVVVVSLAFKWGRWSGVTDTRLLHIEEKLERRKA